MPELELIGPLGAAKRLGSQTAHAIHGVVEVGAAVETAHPDQRRAWLDSCVLRARASLAA